MSAISPVTPTKRKPEDVLMSPDKKHKNTEEEELANQELTEEDMMEIEDAAASLDARQDGEDKNTIMKIVENEKFDTNHPIEVIISERFL